MKFSVCHGKIRLRVQVLPNVHEVHKAYHEGISKRNGSYVYSFFESEAPGSTVVGTVYFAEGSRLFELVPHEVGHALLEYFKSVDHADDEKFCTVLGLLTARILDRIDPEH